MKRLLSILLISVTLSGCSISENDINQVIGLRTKLQNGDQCSFDTCITVDYGESLSSFELSCKIDDQQNWEITVIRPQTIAGITCRIAGEKGQLTFDDKAVAFEMIADGQITPISAPWLVMKALAGGYINSTVVKNDGLVVRIDDSYSDFLFSVDLWLNENNIPYFAEIVWQGKRIVSMDINNFTIV